MKPMDLWDSFGGLDADLIERSQNARKIIPWKAITAAAACVALAVLSVPVVYMTLFAAGKSAPAEDAREISANQEFAWQGSTEMAPGCAEPDGGANLILNDLGRTDVPYFEYEPLPGTFTTVPIPLDDLAALLPGLSPDKGEWTVDEEGNTVSTTLVFPAEGTENGIRVTMAGDIYSTPTPPAYRPDAPGDAELSYVGGTEALLVGLPTRAPGGTAWKLTMVFQKQNGYCLTAKTTPNGQPQALSALQTLLELLP